MGSNSALVFVLLFLVTLPFTCDGGKVLVFPIDGSHWLNMKIILEALHLQGHQITVIRSSGSWYISDSSPYYTSITIHQKKSIHENQTATTSYLQKTLDVRREGGLWGLFVFFWDVFTYLAECNQSVAEMARSIFENKTLIDELKETRYDVCLTDPELPGGVLLAHFLKLPMVFSVRWLFNGEGHFTIAPTTLSCTPAWFTFYNDKMDFFQRVNNLFHYGLLYCMYRFFTNPPYQVLCDQYFGPDVTALSLMQGADIWLMRMDFTFEFPRPTMPNVVYIGGFQGKPSKPLPSDLEEFVQSSGEHGVIIMTFGSWVGDLGPEKSEIIASALASFPQKIVWRQIGQRPATLGNNTRLVEWLPQNDLLGHPKTKLFISHGGNNGLYEAIYHGVPVLGMPLIFDQMDNMVRIKARGGAEMVDVTTMDVESLTNALKNILDPEKPYQQNMLKMSQLHHDKPMKPLDTAVYWIEFVMRHKGAAHLRTESYKLPWYVYHSLDVMGFLAACGLLITVFLLQSCKCLIGCLFKKIQPITKSKKE